MAAAEAVGLEARTETDAAGLDVVVVLPDGSMMYLEVKPVSLVTAASAPGQARQWPDLRRQGAAGVIVADRITADGRDQLTRAGWNWLDLRGHLRLAGPGLLIDADVPAQVEQGPDRSGLVGRVGIELAVLLLLAPEKTVGVRDAAKALSRSPSAISDSFRALRAAGLVGTERKPAVPALFWELAAQWKPLSRDLATLPSPGPARDNAVLNLGFDDVESTTGWALSDTVAAAAYGAPVGMRADHPRDFYVPDQSTFRRAVQVLGSAVTATSRAGRVRLAPVSMVCDRRVDATGWASEEWPLADPLFVALDLAQDPGRGREILDGWTPRGRWRRVW
ncbi:helix-turn-helix domain-containing protein [Pseudonocardia humida]|uniref:helix-turn-helix domain-containing protein n=1 Tax=Pseudonocardia humida TaxID=2800819 RepID=UPI00207D4DAD|nr:helix-turn-helix domain-containing protein [Pseudonocardia humida]